MTDRPSSSSLEGARPTSGASPRAEVPAPARDAAADAPDLLRLLAAGDHGALTTLYEAWFSRALGLARRITGRDESFCLDVVQETFVRVIDHAPKLARLAAREDLDRWLTTVVRSAAIDLVRRESRRGRREATVARNERGPEREPGAAARAEWLQGQIALLDAEERELVLLRFGRGHTLNDAARAVGTTIGAAYGRIRRAVGRMSSNASEVDHE